MGQPRAKIGANLRRRQREVRDRVSAGDDHRVALRNVRRRYGTERRGVRAARRNLERHPLHAERVMRDLLSENPSAQIGEGRSVTHQPRLEARQQRLAQRFENHLRCDDRFQKLPTRSGTRDQCVELRVGIRHETQCGGAERNRCSVEHAPMHGFLPRLRAEEPSRMRVVSDGGLRDRCGVRDLFPERDVAQEVTERTAAIRSARKGGPFVRRRQDRGGVPFSRQS